jgi:hypothetical protein
MTRESDRRLTPEWLIALAREFGGGTIALDVCTEPRNPTGAEMFYTSVDNGLERDWLDYACGGLVWCNCPFSIGQVQLWSDKCVLEARLGCEILLLTKDDCRTSWYAFLNENADLRCRIRRGVGFSEPDGNGGWRKMPAPSWGHALHYFGRQRRRFTRIFGAIGEVTQLLGPQESST